MEKHKEKFIFTKKKTASFFTFLLFYIPFNSIQNSQSTYQLAQQDN